MTTRKNVGDRTEPCCTLQCTGIEGDMTDLNLTRGERLLYQALKSFQDLPFIPA